MFQAQDNSSWWFGTDWYEYYCLRIRSLNIPVPFRYGVSFDVSAIISLGLVYLITAIEAYGDITANSLISGQPVEGEKFMKRASGGILADGFNSMVAGIFNSFLAKN